MEEYLVVQRTDGEIDVKRYEGKVAVADFRRWVVLRMDSELAALRWAMRRWK